MQLSLKQSCKGREDSDCQRGSRCAIEGVGGQLCPLVVDCDSHLDRLSKFLRDACTTPPGEHHPSSLRSRKKIGRSAELRRDVRQHLTARACAGGRGRICRRPKSDVSASGQDTIHARAGRSGRAVRSRTISEDESLRYQCATRISRALWPHNAPRAQRGGRVARMARALLGWY